MIELYPQIKAIHVATALTSGTLFALRGSAVQLRMAWPMSAGVRYLSYSIDSVLLITALWLVILLPGAVFANGWLAMKLVLLVAYILFGTFALKRGRTRKIRLLCFAVALFVFVNLYAIARTHDPLGPWMLLRDWVLRGSA